MDDEFLTADAEGALGFATDADTIDEILHDLCAPTNKEQVKKIPQPFLQRELVASLRNLIFWTRPCTMFVPQGSASRQKLKLQP